MLGIWATEKLATKIGNSKKDGKKSKRIEDLQLPGFLSIFNENVVATSILMLVFFGIIIGILGKDLMHEIDPSFAETQNFFFYMISKSFNFAVYVTILQLGVRMFVNELTESFQGISNKLLPGSVPAVDCASVYGFGSPQAITIGFLFGALGQFIAIIGLIVFKSPVFIITGFVPVFFDNATFAVYANKSGGLKAATIIPFASGIIQVLGGAFAAWYFGTAQYGGWHGNFDWDTLWPLFGVIMKNLQYVGLALVIVFLLAIPQIQYRKNKDTYFLIT